MTHFRCFQKRRCVEPLYWIARIAVLTSFAFPVRAEEPTISFNLLTLPSSQLAQATLQTEAAFFWEQNPLRSGLHEVSQVHGLTIWLDRRIDPSQPITLATKPSDANKTLMTRLKQIAELSHCDVGLIENVIYFGPHETVSQLQFAAVVLHDAISKQAGQQNSILKDLEWPELTTPAALLRDIEKRWGIEVTLAEPSMMPHDLFHSGSFSQPTSLATQLTILLGGFGLQAECHGSNRFRIAELEDSTHWQALYAKSQLELRKQNDLTSDFPGSSLAVRGARGLVRGPVDFHLALLAPPARQAAPAINDKALRWSFEVKNAPLIAVMNKLSSSLSLEVSWDAACTDIEKGRLVSFQVQESTLDQLLDAISASSNLKLTRKGKAILIAP